MGTMPAPSTGGGGFYGKGKWRRARCGEIAPLPKQWGTMHGGMVEAGAHDTFVTLVR